MSLILHIIICTCIIYSIWIPQSRNGTTSCGFPNLLQSCSFNASFPSSFFKKNNKIDCSFLRLFNITSVFFLQITVTNIESVEGIMTWRCRLRENAFSFFFFNCSAASFLSFVFRDVRTSVFAFLSAFRCFVIFLDVIIMDRATGYS